MIKIIEANTWHMKSDSFSSQEEARLVNVVHIRLTSSAFNFCLINGWWWLSWEKVLTFTQHFCLYNKWHDFDNTCSFKPNKIRVTKTREQNVFLTPTSAPFFSKHCLHKIHFSLHGFLFYFDKNHSHHHQVIKQM